MQTERVPRAGTYLRQQPSREANGAFAVVVTGLLLLGFTLSLRYSQAAGATSEASTAPTATPAGGGHGVWSASDSAAPPYSLKEIKTIFQGEAAKPRFDGTVLGWLIADHRTLEAAGAGTTQLSLSCSPQQVDAGVSTSLDFSLGYMPSGLKVETDGPTKWTCGDKGLVVSQAYTVHSSLGVGVIWIERAVVADRSVAMDAPADSVESSKIRGAPAILFHTADDRTGLGFGRVLVIEDAQGPEYTTLSVSAENAVPFGELIQVVEGLK